MKLRTTQAGPHRDDLCFDIRRYGYPEIRFPGAAAHRSAFSEAFRDRAGEAGKSRIRRCLLLDDVLSELDKQQAETILLDGIHDIQTLITCTGDSMSLSRTVLQINKVFRVKRWSR